MSRSGEKPGINFLILLPLLIGSFFNAFISAAVNVALPDMLAGLGGQTFILSWIPKAYLLAAAIFLIPSGWFADNYGRKKTFLIGMAIFLLSSLGMFFCREAYTAVVLRFLQGIGGALIMATSAAIVAIAFPVEIRGRVIGMQVTAVYLGLAFAPFLGGFMTTAFGWPSLFMMNFISGMVSFALMAFGVKQEWKNNIAAPLDKKGFLVFVIASLMLVLGFDHPKTPLSFVIGFMGILAFILFWRVESRVKSPMLDTKLFVGNRYFTYSNLAALINYAATFAITFMLSLYLQYVKGFSPREAGSVLVFQPLMMALTAFVAGRLSDKYKPGLIASIGMSLVAIGLLMLAFAGLNTGIGFIIFSLVILGTGFGFFSSPNTNAIMSSVEKQHYGIASAVLSAMRNFGQLLSIMIATLLVQWFLGDEKISPSNVGVFVLAARYCFIIFSVLSLGGVFLSYSRSRN